MELILPFVLKSLLVSGVTLGLLKLLAGRSAAERSMVAHFGLLALLIVPVGSIFLPQLVIEAAVLPASAPAANPANPIQSAATAEPGALPATATASGGAVEWWPLLYGFPAALLLGITGLALIRLFALRARASVLVEPSWLSALAHAQRRMNFKHGTALLTSPDLHSPISWGVLRPVILLNDEALEARHEAEAIIAHELAHVRGLDWAKLLMARLVTALHWFNPLVWLLAREAHQLREETADDAVLASDVSAPDYAQLLVGVARHDCRGLLIGAHGVAPGKNSLSRRVRRVLDNSLPRSPVARGFAAGLALGVVATAAPLAALTITPSRASADRNDPVFVAAPGLDRSLPAVVARAVTDATARSGAIANDSVASALARAGLVEAPAGPRLAAAAHPHADADSRHPPLPPAPPAPLPPRREKSLSSDPVERVMAFKALGITPAYASAMREANPHRRISDDELLEMRAVGVTPDYLRDLAAAGYRGLAVAELTGMRAVGVTGDFIRRLKAAGVTGLTPNKLIELRVTGISAADFTHRRWGSPPGAEPPHPPEPPDVDVDVDANHNN